MPELNVVTVDTDGLEVDVDITKPGGGAASAYTSAAGTAPISLPATISTPTQFWLAEAGDFTFIISKVGGDEVHREVVGVSDRDDQPKTLLLKSVLPLSAIVALATGGGSGASESLVSVFSGQDLIPWPAGLDIASFNVPADVTIGTDLAVHVDGTGIDVLTTGRYIIEQDITIYTGTHADMIGVVVTQPMFLLGNNWITNTEGGTWWATVDRSRFAGNAEYTRTFPPITLAAGERIGVQAQWAPGIGDGGTSPTFSVLLTVSRIA